MARFVVLLVAVVLGACGGASDADEAETTYGTPVDATEAFPAPAVAAEDRLFTGRVLTVDGRITAIRASGCEVHLATDAAPLVVTAPRAERGSSQRAAPRPTGGSSQRAVPRTDAGDCAWQVPKDAQGFAVAAGTLRVADDTLRLSANGVRVTPVRFSSPNS